MYDSSIYYYKKALNYLDSNGQSYTSENTISFNSAKAVVYGNLADIYYVYGKLDTAISLLKTSIAVNLQKDYTNDDAMLSQIKLAKMYFQTKDYVDFEHVLALVKSELDSIQNLNVALNWNKLMWDYCALNNQPAKAYPYITTYLIINDSIHKQEDKLLASDIEGKIKGKERQYQLALMNKDTHSQKIYMVVATVLVFLALAIIFIILYGAARTRKNLRTLTSLNNKITEQKAELEYAITELQQRDKDKTRILRSVAHDVMNPIAAIQALTDILMGESDSYTDDQKEMFGLIKQSCQNSLSLSKDILEASQQLVGANLKKEWVDINDLVKNCVELLNFKAATKHQNITIIFSQEKIKAFINKDKVWRVLSNLIGNAIKFSFENSIIEVTVEQLGPFSKLEMLEGGKEIYNGEDKVLISIKDTGIGIPEKNKPLIFDMFTEAKNTGTAGETPHGLGLSITLQIVKAHGGNIWFDSIEGKGTTFYVELPIYLV